MKDILIASFDMEVGGVERSLISMLNNFDYDNYNVDLMLYSHTGDFMNLLPKQPNLLEENKKYKTFRMSIVQTLKNGNLGIGFSRNLSRLKAKSYNTKENGYIQMQYMWKYALPFLPKINKEYDVAISYLWPHYFVADKVKAKIKIAWIHTDYSTIDTDIKVDLQMWNKFDYIVSISDDVTNAFLSKYPSLEEKIILVENITSPEFVRTLSNENIDNPMTRDNRFKIVSVARLSHAKGIDNAVRAMKVLKDRGYNDIAWYVVGYGGDEPMIRELISKNDVEDRVILLGKQINPYPYIKEADLYVQPSRYEGKAVTVSEAQIIGRPVMITNYTTAKSQVNNGFDGYICELSVNGIADGIEKLYKDCNLRNIIANNCKKQEYDNKIELSKLYNIIG